MKKPFIIGSRGSKLALYQAHVLKRYLEYLEYDDLNVEIKIISTLGDRLQASDAPLPGGKGAFVQEIEAALHAGEIDAAVHSLKDVPATLPEGLELLCYLAGEDPRDVLVSRHGFNLHNLPYGSKVGTASPRRAAWIRHMRPDVHICGFRGNVETRIAKLKKGEVDITFLAAAGLRRLGVWDECAEMIVALATHECVPAAGQGIIVAEARANDERARYLLGSVDHMATRYRAECERAALVEFGEGSCHQPVGIFAELRDNERMVMLSAFVASPCGQEYAGFSHMASVEQRMALGALAGKRLCAARSRFIGPSAIAP